MTFIFKLGKIEKLPALLVQKQLPQSTANQITATFLSNTKDPSNYQDRTGHKNEQKPIDFKTDDERPTMVKPNVAAQKKKRVEKRKILEKQLDENTIRVQKLKSDKLQIYFLLLLFNKNI